MQPLVAMISYQSADIEYVELLHAELAFRGLAVIHDHCTFPQGTRIVQNMADGVARCDGFVPYLTPRSLYESKPGVPHPALDDELKPAMARRRSSLAAVASAELARPVIMPLTHGIGDPRLQAPERVRKASGEDISTLWTPVALDQTTGGITQQEAARAAGALLGALLSPGTGPDEVPVEMTIATRGSGQPPRFITIDGTGLLGGATARPGEPATWARFLSGLRDVEATLARWGRTRHIVIEPRAHLSGAVAVGRVFHQAAGWQPEVLGRHGPVAMSDETGHSDLAVSWDPGPPGAEISIEIDLLGHPVSALATEVLAGLSRPIAGRLQLVSRIQGTLSAEDVQAMAGAAATQVRTTVSQHRPNTIHVFCAAPAEFCVLVGHKLTSLHAALQLYERDGDRYVQSLYIPSDIG